MSIGFEDVTAELLALKLVESVKVTFEPDRRGRRRAVAYVVLAPGVTDMSELLAGTTSDELIGDWQAVYDLTYGEGSRRVSDDLDLSGWRDSYTGRSIDERHMREWIDQTVLLVADTRPRRIIEVGCGTGLLMFRLADKTDWYLGLDLSSTAIANLTARLGPLAERVRLLQAPAHEIHGPGFPDRCAALLQGLPTPYRPDCILINSVTQCFPSADYLIDVLDAAVALLEPGGALVVGDVRSLATQKAFATSIELAADPGVSGGSLEQRVVERIRGERELLIDPAFFAAWAATQQRMVRVSVRPKPGTADNELNRFRYDAVLTVDPASPVSVDPVSPAVSPAASAPKWLTWSDVDACRHGLRDALRLAIDAGTAIGVTGIPNRLVRPFTYAVPPAAVPPAAVPPADGEEVTAAELIEALSGLPAEVLLSPGNRSEGELAVVCGLQAQAHTLWDLAAIAVNPRSLVNDPLTVFLTRRAPQLLRQYLTRRLPAAAVPGSIVVVTERAGDFGDDRCLGVTPGAPNHADL